MAVFQVHVCHMPRDSQTQASGQFSAYTKYHHSTVNIARLQAINAVHERMQLPQGPSRNTLPLCPTWASMSALCTSSSWK